MGSKLYIPGRSNTVLLLGFLPISPNAGSKVTPGKLPTFWRMPVSTLNNVDLPLFGVPTKAVVSCIFR